MEMVHDTRLTAKQPELGEGINYPLIFWGIIIITGIFGYNYFDNYVSSCEDNNGTFVMNTETRSVECVK